MAKTSYVIDFDSTFVKIEALDTLSEIALAENKNYGDITQEIKTITNLGMEGKISFPESLSRRLTLFAPNKQHIQALIEILHQSITKSILQNKLWFEQNANNIYIISGGFKEYIIPVVDRFSISPDHVLANQFIFNESGVVQSFDPTCLLAQPSGKVAAIQSLQLKGNVIVIGDGYTDYQIKQAGKASTFIAFIENVQRESVVKHADQTAKSWDECIKYVTSKV